VPDGVDEAVERACDEPPHEQHDDERHGGEQRERVEMNRCRVRCVSALHELPRLHHLHGADDLAVRANSGRTMEKTRARPRSRA
jgi:hypothetical protein